MGFSVMAWACLVGSRSTLGWRLGLFWVGGWGCVGWAIGGADLILWLLLFFFNGFAVVVGFVLPA